MKDWVKLSLPIWAFIIIFAILSFFGKDPNWTTEGWGIITTFLVAIGFSTTFFYRYVITEGD